MLHTAEQTGDTQSLNIWSKGFSDPFAQPCRDLPNGPLTVRPTFEAVTQLYLQKQQQYQAQHGPGKETNETTHRLLQLCFIRPGKFLPFSSPSPFHKSFACRAASLGSLILLSKVNRPPVQQQMNNKQTEGVERKKKKEKKNLTANVEIFSVCYIFPKSIEKKKKKIQCTSYAPRVTLHKAFWQLQCPPVPRTTPQPPRLSPRSPPSARAHIQSPKNPGTQTAVSFSSMPKQAKLLNPF